MVLVDTSVWISHLCDGNVGLEMLLNDDHVICHPFIIGELACGNLKNRLEILSLLQALPMAINAEHEEVMRFIDDYRLMGKGLGYIDIHLLASAILSEMPLWTFDKRLHEVSVKLKVDFRY
ncbi:MAG: type II toxin-antitoxin system VapC family toxin [Nitrospinae bacterium]|nr:type II toxin-antitoxin system VapC family toxin [Nitrospinota bacterium]